VDLLITHTAHILEEADRVNQAALHDIFGRRSAQVAAGAASSPVPLVTPLLAPDRGLWSLEVQPAVAIVLFCFIYSTVKISCYPAQPRLLFLVLINQVLIIPDRKSE